MDIVGYIGLGHMGRPMVKNLLKAGFKVMVYDLDPNAVKACVAMGAQAASDLINLAKQSDIVVTMVQSGEQVKSICLGQEGLFANINKTALYIDSSSIDINVTRELHQQAAQQNIAMVEAPVSGGVAGAEAASLTIMVGGEENHYRRASALLTYLGKKVMHAGPPGSGQAVKICNNLLLAISMIGTCEAFNLARKLGLDPQKFFDISSNASGQCWSMTSYCPEPGILEGVPSSHNYEPGFAAEMMLKDIRLGKSAAETVSANIPLGSLAEEIYQQYVEAGGRGKDFSGIMEYIANAVK